MHINTQKIKLQNICWRTYLFSIKEIFIYCANNLSFRSQQRTIFLKRLCEKGVSVAITTKFGDKGKTMILFGHVVDKTHPILDVVGTIDELNANIGIARASVVAPGLKQELLNVQKKLFIIGAEVATREEDFPKLKKTIQLETVQEIEEEIEKLEEYNNIDNWSIPGEALSSAFIEKSRTVARRLERRLIQQQHHNEQTRLYLNRLSDYLWLLAQKEEYYLRGVEKQSTEPAVNHKQQTIF